MRTLGLILVLVVLLPLVYFQQINNKEPEVLSVQTEVNHWFILHRKSNLEFLYFGEPGRKDKSALVNVFKVKTGIPGERPTPLPQLLGREYWLITGEFEVLDNPETAPYFLTLNVPVTEELPFGPEPYLECNGQCNWELPGAFGLHGNNGDPEKLSDMNPGSSGCIRHTAEDITYLYNLLSPESSQVRYYIDDV